MRSNFDELWKHAINANGPTPCPLSENALEEMVQKAVASAPAPMGKSHHRSRTMSLINYLALAACICLIVVPLAMRGRDKSIPTVSYNGQSIQLLCNHQCSPDDVVHNLNTYLESI